MAIGAAYFLIAALGWDAWIAIVASIVIWVVSAMYIINQYHRVTERRALERNGLSQARPRA